MSIFPEINPLYLNDEDLSLRARMQNDYDRAIPHTSMFWQNGEYNYRFYAGDQQAFQDLGYNTNYAYRKKQYYFNRIRPIVSMITGNQRKNRKSTIAVPIESADEETANQFSKILIWLNQKEGIGETISNAFEGACVAGLSFLHPWMDYRFDPINGDIRVDHLAYNEVIVDPFFKNQDLSDCRFVWKRSYIEHQDALALLPGKEDIIEHARATPARDGKFNRMPESFAIQHTNLNLYDEYYYKTYREQLLLVDTVSGETYEWNSSIEGSLDQFLAAYPRITLVKNKVPSYNVAILYNGRCCYDGEQPSGLTELPFVPVLSYYQPSLTSFSYRIRSVVSELVDAQYLFNRRRNIELAMLESQINSGWKYKAGSLVNPKDVFLSGEGRGLAFKDGASLDDAQQIIPAGIHPSVLQLSENLGREMERISGVSEELLGSASDDKAGVLAMIRQGASLTTLQGLFDKLDYSQKLLGRKIIKLIQKNFTPGKVQRIIEQQPTQEFYNKAFAEYDCAVEEGVLTTTQRQMQFTQLAYLKSIGVNIPDDVMVNATTIQNKKELTDRLNAQAQQAQELQQLQLQTQMLETEARTDLAKARAGADRGLQLERTSRVAENEALAVQREAEAVRDENQAMLNLVKAIKEIDTIDMQQLQQLLAMQSIIKQQEQVKREEINQKSSTPQQTSFIEERV